MGGFGRGTRPPGVKATLEDRQTWTTKARRFADAYEKRLKNGDPILSIDFFREEWSFMSKGRLYNWRSTYPSFSAHLLWLEAQAGTEDLVKAKYDADIGAAKRRALVEKQWDDLSDPQEIFLRVLETEKSHERAMEESGMSWPDFRKTYGENEAWRERYALLVGPLPPDLPFFGLLAIDVLLQSALRESKAADAKALLAKLHEGFRPSSQRPAAKGGKKPGRVDRSAMEALYSSMVAQAGVS